MRLFHLGQGSFELRLDTLVTAPRARSAKLARSETPTLVHKNCSIPLTRPNRGLVGPTPQLIGDSISYFQLACQLGPGGWCDHMVLGRNIFEFQPDENLVFVRVLETPTGNYGFHLFFKDSELLLQGVP